jgi:hypothetical protein
MRCSKLCSDRVGTRRIGIPVVLENAIRRFSGRRSHGERKWSRGGDAVNSPGRFDVVAPTLRPTAPAISARFGCNSL